MSSSLREVKRFVQRCTAGQCQNWDSDPSSCALNPSELDYHEPFLLAWHPLQILFPSESVLIPQHHEAGQQLLPVLPLVMGTVGKTGCPLSLKVMPLIPLLR